MPHALTHMKHAYIRVPSAHTKMKKKRLNYRSLHVGNFGVIIPSAGWSNSVERPVKLSSRSY